MKLIRTVGPYKAKYLVRCTDPKCYLGDGGRWDNSQQAESHAHSHVRNNLGHVVEIYEQDS